MNDILNDLEPIKTMRASRAKRRAMAKFLKNKTQENWEFNQKATK